MKNSPAQRRSIPDAIPQIINGKQVTPSPMELVGVQSILEQMNQQLSQVKMQTLSTRRPLPICHAKSLTIAMNRLERQYRQLKVLSIITLILTALVWFRGCSNQETPRHSQEQPKIEVSMQQDSQPIINKQQ